MRTEFFQKVWPFEGERGGGGGGEKEEGKEEKKKKQEEEEKKEKCKQIEKGVPGEREPGMAFLTSEKPFVAKVTL